MNMRQLLIGLLASAVCISAASAQSDDASVGQNPAGCDEASSKKPMASLRSAASIECSKQADLKGLHGFKRVKFRHSCIKQLKKKPH